MVVGAGRGRDLPAIIDRLVARAAESKDAAVAEVRSAVPLSADQTDRLKAALANATGRNVNLKVVVDPSVLGGLVATVGRHRHRRHRPHPPRPAEVTPLVRTEGRRNHG